MPEENTHKTEYWIHADGWIYQGDQIEGARAATEEELALHLAASANAEA